MTLAHALTGFLFPCEYQFHCSFSSNLSCPFEPLDITGIAQLSGFLLEFTLSARKPSVQCQPPCSLTSLKGNHV
jgi:hypothetical protein